MQMYIQAEQTPINVSIKTSTRFGGYSSAPYNSLNMGYFTGDDITNVIKNYYLYEQVANVHKIVTLNQVHGNKILKVDKQNVADILFSKADGLFTFETNLPLGVITADCIPVMISGKRGIAALHCGWRSLNSGIIDNVFKIFNQYNDDIVYAYVGTGICADCYEVREDLVSQLIDNYKPYETLRKKDKEHFLLDMKKLVTNALAYNGLSIDNIEISPYYSCCSENFYSYRLENGKTGRMVTTIVKNG